MPVILDPEGIETSTLSKHADAFAGKVVFEIGCGDGRLTWLYANETKHVVGIDPDANRLNHALRNRPAKLRKRVELYPHSLEAYASEKGEPAHFDTALLSWAL